MMRTSTRSEPALVSTTATHELVVPRSMPMTFCIQPDLAPSVAPGNTGVTVRADRRHPSSRPGQAVVSSWPSRYCEASPQPPWRPARADRLAGSRPGSPRRPSQAGGRRSRPAGWPRGSTGSKGLPTVGTLRDARASDDVDELPHDHREAVSHGLHFGGALGALDGALEVVEHGQERPEQVLAPRPARVLDVPARALAEVVEIRRRAQPLVFHARGLGAGCGEGVNRGRARGSHRRLPLLRGPRGLRSQRRRRHRRLPLRRGPRGPRSQKRRCHRCLSVRRGTLRIPGSRATPRRPEERWPGRLHPRVLPGTLRSELGVRSSDTLHRRWPHLLTRGDRGQHGRRAI